MALGLRPPELPLTGSCPCKAVRFAVTAMPLVVYACHCTECQRWSGSAFSLAMPVAARHFALTRGAPKAYRRTTANGIESTNWFCGDCGGGVFGERTAQPDVVTVRAGTLDDTSWLRPAAHQYLRSAQAWQRVPNRAECFEIMPNDFGALADLWGRMWRVNAGAD